MNQRVSFYLLTTALSLFNDVTSLGIIGGMPAKVRLPFFVAVKIGGLLCGGTYVTPDVVLTSAHCLYIPEKHRWALFREVLVLQTDFTVKIWPYQSTWYTCERYVYHRNYSPALQKGFSSFDLALIKVKKWTDESNARTGFLELCPDWKDYPEGYAIGMGKTYDVPDTRPVKLMGTKLFKYINCEKVYKQIGIPVDEQAQVCYGSPEKSSYRGTCQGDSGGPLIHMDKHDNPICVIGVTSFSSFNCKDPKYPSVFTRAGYFEDWIVESSEDPEESFSSQQSSIYYEPSYSSYYVSPKHP